MLHIHSRLRGGKNIVKRAFQISRQKENLKTHLGFSPGSQNFWQLSLLWSPGGLCGARSGVAWRAGPSHRDWPWCHAWGLHLKSAISQMRQMQRGANWRSKQKLPFPTKATFTTKRNNIGTKPSNCGLKMFPFPSCFSLFKLQGGNFLFWWDNW